MLVFVAQAPPPVLKIPASCQFEVGSVAHESISGIIMAFAPGTVFRVPIRLGPVPPLDSKYHLLLISVRNRGRARPRDRVLEAETCPASCRYARYATDLNLDCHRNGFPVQTSGADQACARAAWEAVNRCAPAVTAAAPAWNAQPAAPVMSWRRDRRMRSKAVALAGLL